MRVSCVLVLALCMAATGCDGSATAPPQATAAPQGSAPSLEVGDQADPPSEWPVRINSVNVTPMLPKTTGDATIIAEMNYNGYHASIEGSAAVRGKDNFTRDFPVVQKHANSGFRGQAFLQMYTLAILSPCGNSLEAQFKFRAWLLGPTGLGTIGTLESDERVRDATDYQPACAPPESTGTGKAKPIGGGNYCYTVRTDHYWYYPDTGTVEYRYSTYKEYCESSY